MPPADNNANVTPPSAPQKQGFMSKIAGMFKKKPAAAVVLPADHTSQTPEPRLDNIATDVGVPGATNMPPQAAPLGDVALTQATMPPVVVPQPNPVAPTAPMGAPVDVQPAAPPSSGFGAGGFAAESTVAPVGIDAMGAPQAGIVSTPGVGAIPPSPGVVPPQPIGTAGEVPVQSFEQPAAPPLQAPIQPQPQSPPQQPPFSGS